jgi:allantoinase
MTEHLLIKNGLVALPGEDDFKKLDIYIENGTIVALGRGLEARGQVLDARDRWVLPGGIDAHVHFDDPGYTDREDFTAGSHAAASGGITTIIDMPCTSIPPVTTVGNMHQKLAVIERKSVVDFGLFGGVCAQSFAGDWQKDIGELAEFVLGFKTYLTSGMQTFQRLNHFQLRQVLEIARRTGLPVLLHAEDNDYIETATTVAQGQGDSPREYYESRPEIAETLAVSSALQLAESVGGDLHVVHLATAQAASLLHGRDATGETAPHYLEFTEQDFERIGAALKVAPTVKKAGNREALWELLASGVIDFVASDHAPSPERDKNTGSIWTDYGGIPGVGTLLPYMVSEGYMRGRLSLKRLTEVLSSTPAKRYGIFRTKGSISVGNDADLVLFDPEGEWLVEGKRFLSRGKITPFEGMRFRGRIIKTLLRGQVIYDSVSGVQVKPGYGRWIKRNHGQSSRKPG